VIHPLDIFRSFTAAELRALLRQEAHEAGLYKLRVEG
jgi:hypothetical protein